MQHKPMSPFTSTWHFDRNGSLSSEKRITASPDGPTPSIAFSLFTSGRPGPPQLAVFPKSEPLHRRNREILSPRF
jgi:hypothetical protein